MAEAGPGPSSTRASAERRRQESEDEADEDGGLGLGGLLPVRRPSPVPHFAVTLVWETYKLV